jgi:hypothetical protein
MFSSAIASRMAVESTRRTVTDRRRLVRPVRSHPGTRKLA